MARRSIFHKFAKWTAHATGLPIAFLIAAGVVVVWIITGPIFDFSNTWQLVINTATSITTFLMVFLIQHTQNRDTAAMQIKLDEIIRATKGAHNALLDLEELEERDLTRIQGHYRKLAAAAREELKQGNVDTASPNVDVS